MATATATVVVLGETTDSREALRALQAGQCTMEAYLTWDAARVARLESAAASKASNGNGAAPIGLAIGKGGQIVIRGFGQFPQNLYPEQYYRLVAEWAKIDSFAQKHLREDWSGDMAESRGGPKVKVTRRLSEKSAGSAAKYRTAALAAMREASK